MQNILVFFLDSSIYLNVSHCEQQIELCSDLLRPTTNAPILFCFHYVHTQPLWLLETHQAPHCPSFSSHHIGYYYAHCRSHDRAAAGRDNQRRCTSRLSFGLPTIQTSLRSHRFNVRQETAVS